MNLNQLQFLGITIVFFPKCWLKELILLGGNFCEERSFASV